MESTNNTHDYFFKIKNLKSKIILECHPCDKNSKLKPLYEAATSVWNRSPKDFLRALIEKHGIDIEGVTGYSFYHEYPDEWPKEANPQGIIANVFDNEVVVSELFFVDLVLDFAKTHQKAIAKYHIDLGPPDYLEALEEVKKLRANGYFKA